MHYAWNETRPRAAKFAEKFANAHYEKGETQTFYNEFFQVFGVERRDVASYERSVAKLSGNKGFIDLFWPRVLLVEQKSAGSSLEAAEIQALGYFQGLKRWERPRYLLLCDFQNFQLIDLDERTECRFTLAQLPQYIEKFGFIMGVQTPTFKDQDPANIKAAELIGKLHDTLDDSGFAGEDLEKFLVRIVFCLFSDDTGVFPTRNMMLQWLHNRTLRMGQTLGQS